MLHNIIKEQLSKDSRWKSIRGLGDFSLLDSVGINAHNAPMVFIIPNTMTPEYSHDRPNDYIQKIKHQVSVVMVLPAVDDATGENAMAQFDQHMGALRVSLLGFNNSDILDAISFDGMNLINVADGLAWYETQWSATYLWRK